MVKKYQRRLVIRSFSQFLDDHLAMGNSIYPILVAHPRNLLELLRIPNHSIHFIFHDREGVAA